MQQLPPQVDLGVFPAQMPYRPGLIRPGAACSPHVGVGPGVKTDELIQSIFQTLSLGPAARFDDAPLWHHYIAELEQCVEAEGASWDNNVVISALPRRTLGVSTAEKSRS